MAGKAALERNQPVHLQRPQRLDIIDVDDHRGRVDRLDAAQRFCVRKNSECSRGNSCHLIEEAIEPPDRLIYVEPVGHVVHVGARAHRPLLDREVAPAASAAQEGPGGRGGNHDKRDGIAVATLDQLGLKVFVVKATYRRKLGVADCI